MRYYPLYALLYLLSLLPWRVLYAVGDLLFYPLYHWLRYRRGVVERNLRESFPEKTDEQRQAIERQFYHFLCDYAVEVIKLFSISKRNMMRHMEFVGVDKLRAELDREGKKFCFLYLGHYCNWEYVASLQYWLPAVHCGQIYHKLYNRAFNRLFLRIRGQFGGENIPMKETFHRILQLRRQERPVMIGFIADQAPGWESMHQWTTFLHHDTSFFIGTERIGKLVDAAIYYVDIERPRRGYYRATFRLMSMHPASLPDYQLTDAYARCLEEQIRRHPAYWLWSHKRWKRTKEEWLRRRDGKAVE